MHAFIEWFFAGQLRNVALIKNLQSSVRNLRAIFVWEKLKHFGNSLNSFRNELDPAEHTKEHPRREMNTGKKTVMKVSSRWFYRQQEAVLKPNIAMDYRSLRRQ